MFAQDHSAFIQSKTKLRNLTRKLRADYENNIANQSKGKPNSFWRCVKSKLKAKVRIPTLKKSDGTSSVSPRDKAETLNCYFSSLHRKILPTSHIFQKYSQEIFYTL